VTGLDVGSLDKRARRVVAAVAVSNPAGMQPNTLFSDITIGPTSVAGPLRLVSLLGRADGPVADLLEESLADGRTTIAELDADGVVSRVRVHHTGPAPLLLLDGEEILGAKQNRMVNASFLIEPGRTVDIPVSCVERLRWDRSGGHFRSSDTTATARLRAAKHARLCRALDAGHGYDTNQGAVWRDVDAYLGRTGVRSPTAASHDGYTSRRLQGERALAAVEPIAGQIGLAAVYGRSLVSLDLFGSASLYRRAWKKIGRGLLAELFERDVATDEDAALAVVGDALGAMAASDPVTEPAPGGGEILHARSSGLSFTAIVSHEAMFHAVVTADAEA
jgi:hypothetical protein